MSSSHLKTVWRGMVVCLLGLLTWACAATPPAGRPTMPLTVSAVSPLDGRTAEAVVTEGGEGRVVVRDASGRELFVRVLPARVTALNWSGRGELLAFGYRLQRYTFGGNLTQTLFRMTTKMSDAVRLADQTIKPATAARFEEHSAPQLQVAFAPMGDELVYTRLHDPPDAPPYLQLVHRNWQSEHERELVRLPLAAVQLTWAGDDTVKVRQETGVVRCLQLWDAPTTLGACEGTPQGGQDHPEAYDERRWTLRRWRYLGLISPEEYRHLAEKETP